MVLAQWLIQRYGPIDATIGRRGSGADPGFLKRGSILGLQAKKRGQLWAQFLKSLHHGTKRGVRTPWTHRGQRTNISHSETVGREGGTRFLEPNLAFAYFDIISSFWIKKTCTHTPTVFCCIPMAVCHRWSRYLPIYISFARGMLKVTTTYARRMCWL